MVVQAPISTPAPISTWRAVRTVGAALVLAVTESVRADDRSGMDGRARADPRILVKHHVGIQRHALGQAAAGHHVDARVNGRPGADFHLVATVAPDARRRRPRCGRGADLCQRADAIRRTRRGGRKCSTIWVKARWTSCTSMAGMVRSSSRNPQGTTAARARVAASCSAFRSCPRG